MRINGRVRLGCCQGIGRAITLRLIAVAPIRTGVVVMIVVLMGVSGVGKTTVGACLAACLVLAALPVTGQWMWWKRRPRGRTGVPRKLPFDNVSAWVWIAIVLMCVLFPIFGISVVAIVVGDRILHQVRSAFAAVVPSHDRRRGSSHFQLEKGPTVPSRSARRQIVFRMEAAGKA